MRMQLYIGIPRTFLQPSQEKVLGAKIDPQGNKKKQLFICSLLNNSIVHFLTC